MEEEDSEEDKANDITVGLPSLSALLMMSWNVIGIVFGG